MFASTILEMVGLGFIFSIVGVLSPGIEANNILINKISVFLQLDKTEIISYLLLNAIILDSISFEGKL